MVYGLREHMENGEPCVDDFEIDLISVAGLPDTYISAAGKQAIKQAMNERVLETLMESSAARRTGELIDSVYERRHDA